MRPIVLFLMLLLVGAPATRPVGAQGYRVVVRCTGCQRNFSETLLGKRCPRCLQGQVRQDYIPVTYRCSRCGQSSREPPVGGVCSDCRVEMQEDLQAEQSRQNRRVIYRIRRRRSPEPAADEADEDGAEPDRGHHPGNPRTMERYDGNGAFVCLNCRRTSPTPRKGRSCAGCDMRITHSLGAPPGMEMPEPEPELPEAILEKIKADCAAEYPDDRTRQAACVDLVLQSLEDRFPEGDEQDEGEAPDDSPAAPDSRDRQRSPATPTRSAPGPGR